jgi:hypothetical protein
MIVWTAMRVWEIVGWILLGLGLVTFYRCYALLMEEPPLGPRIIPASPLLVIGIVVFRGGIHLLKVAAAARVCRGMAEQVLPAGLARKTGLARGAEATRVSH